MLVSAIVVNRNGSRHLEICLPSLLQQSYRPLEIIVVDNASTDGSANVVKSCGCRWLPFPRNIGLASALNEGAAAASGELLLFLNNDMRFDRAFVESMVAVLLQDPKVFSVDAIQYNWDGSKQVHMATRLAKKPEAEMSCAIVPELYMCQEHCDSPRPVLMSSAANMLTRKAMFKALGGFDERLFFGCEDTELCWRAWVRGWKSVLAPAAICWHRVGGSSRSAEGERMGFRGVLGGRLLMATKLMPVSYQIRTWLAYLGGLARDLVHLRTQNASDRIDVLRHHLQYITPLIRERRKIYGRAGMSAGEQLECMLHLSNSTQ